MATRLEKLPLESGGYVLIQVYEVEGRVERVGIGDKAARTFEAAWDTVSPVIDTLAKKIASCGQSETQVKFGIKIGADLNAIIAGTTGEANFEVTLTWKA